MVMGSAVAAEIRRQAEAAYPEECCGILLGREVDGERRAERAMGAENVAEGSKRERYVVDPRAILAAEREAGGMKVVGFYHSHPDQAAVPSATDAAGAWEVYSYVIVSVRAGVAGEMRAWRLGEGGAGFMEEDVV